MSAGLAPLLPGLLSGAAVAVGWAAPLAAEVRMSSLTATQAVRAGRRSPAVPTARPPRAEPPVPLLALVGAVTGLLAGGPGAAAALSLLVVLAARVLSRRRAAAASAVERQRAGQACRLLATELRAGRSPAQALDLAGHCAVGPTGRTLLVAGSAAGLGGDVAAVLRAGAPASAVPEVLRALAVCWHVCATSGSGLAKAVDRLEEALRAKAVHQRLLDEELASPRATALLLAVLPAMGLLLGTGLGANPLHVLFATPVGLVCLVGGVSLELVGLAWTSRLASGAGPPGPPDRS